MERAVNKVQIHNFSKCIFTKILYLIVISLDTNHSDIGILKKKSKKLNVLFLVFETDY